MWKVLIVDDEYIMRQGLRYILSWEEEGYEIIAEATNGKEALDIMNDLVPHIIICDVVMPLMDGIDFIGMVHNTHPEIQIITLSGYDKFEYVKQALMSGASDYILKPVLSPDVLRQALHNAVLRLPDQPSHPLGCTSVDPSRLLERYLSSDNHTPGTQSFSHCFHHELFCLYAVDVKKQNSMGKNLHEVLYKKILREIESHQSFDILSALLKEETACLLCCFSRHEQPPIHQFLTNLTLQLSVLCEDIFAVCSRSFSSLEQTYEIFYQEVSPCIGLKFYFPEKNILFKDELLTAQPEKAIKFNFFKYSNLIENRQFDQAIRLMNEYNEQALMQYTEVHRLKNQIKNVLYHFLDLLPLSDEYRETLRHDFFHQIDGASNQNEYLAQFSQITHTLRDLCDSAAPRDKRIEEMIAYIHENYQQELHLEDLAVHFNFNYSYLSTYFSSQMHESFSDYLNRVRIEHACQLLQKATLPISEISKEVGYSEHSYFCRVFRKITGKTPSAWRRST